MDIFKYLFYMTLSDRSIYMQMKTGTFKRAFSKNTIYHPNRFINKFCLQLLAFVSPIYEATAIGGMSRAQLDAKLMKGVESMQPAKAYTADKVDTKLARESGI